MPSRPAVTQNELERRGTVRSGGAGERGPCDRVRRVALGVPCGVECVSRMGDCTKVTRISGPRGVWRRARSRTRGCRCLRAAGEERIRADGRARRFPPRVDKPEVAHPLAVRVARGRRGGAVLRDAAQAYRSIGSRCCRRTTRRDPPSRHRLVDLCVSHTARDPKHRPRSPPAAGAPRSARTMPLRMVATRSCPHLRSVSASAWDRRPRLPRPSISTCRPLDLPPFLKRTAAPASISPPCRAT